MKHSVFILCFTFFILQLLLLAVQGRLSFAPLGVAAKQSLTAKVAATTHASTFGAKEEDVKFEIFGLRGGIERIQSKKNQPSKARNAINKVKEVFSKVEPATRAYLLITLFCTVVHMAGLPAKALFALDSSRWYELWRPLTAIAYLGPPSMSMANSLYFLLRYGQTLEERNGTGPHAWFLIVQTALLTVLGLFLGFPFQAQALIAAIIYVSSRVDPMEKVYIQFGLAVSSWQLPYCMMIIDCLSQQTASAAWPHVLGILTGHVYHFYTQVWPSLGGRAWLTPPAWVIQRLGGEKRPNLGNGFDFRHKQAKTSSSAEKTSTPGGSSGAGDDSSDISRLNRSLNSGTKKLSKLLSNKKGRKL